MKRWTCFAVVPILVLLYLVFFTPGKASTDNVLDAGLSFKAEDNYLTYENSTFSFKIDYPTTWIVAENNPDLFLRVKDVVVNFFSPPETFSDVNSENLNVVVSNDEEAASASLDDVPNNVIPAIKAVFGVQDSIASEDLHIDGNPAKKITYSYKMFDKVLQNTQIFSIKSGKVYVITYVCEPLTCSSYMPTFNKMIDSFRFT